MVRIDHDGPLEQFKLRMQQLDEDHQARIRKINRDCRIMYWMICIVVFVATFGKLVFWWIQGTL